VAGFRGSTLLALVLLSVPLLVSPGGADGANRSPKKSAGAGALRAAIAAGRAMQPAGRCSPRALASSRRTLRRLAQVRQRPAGRQHRRAVRRHRRLIRRAKACRQAPPAGRTGRLYWGAWIGSQLTGDEAPWDMGAAESFERMAGKQMSLIHFSSPFADCSSPPCEFYEFPAGPMDDIRESGAIPFFSWASQSTPAMLDQPQFQLADVIAGAHDDYIRSFAEEARDWGHPFFLRFNWEMNGDWFAWHEGVNGNQPGEAVAAWRHVHDIFTEVGATNAAWVWCPNVDPTGSLKDLRSLYPGDRYVDWTGLDGYNWGTNPVRPDRWRGFDELFHSTYSLITESIAPGKPLVIAEIGSTEQGGSKAAWIEQALGAVAAGYPQVRALMWFEKYDDGMDWPIETSSGAASAFAGGIGQPAFVEGAALAGGAIEPPS
jgi:hypothetical protein